MVELLELPDEVLSNVFRYLTAPEFSKASLTCKKFRSLEERNDAIWKWYCWKDYKTDDANLWTEWTFRDFYRKVLFKYGFLLGWWQRKLQYFGGLVHVKVEKDAFVAYECLPPLDGTVVSHLEELEYANVLDNSDYSHGASSRLRFHPIFAIQRDGFEVGLVCYASTTSGVEASGGVCSYAYSHRSSLPISSTATLDDSSLIVRRNVDGFEFICRHPDKHQVDFNYWLRLYFGIQSRKFCVNEVLYVLSEHGYDLETKFKALAAGRSDSKFVPLSIQRQIPKSVSHLRINPGLYSSLYSSHGWEIFHLTYSGDGKKLTGTKITGDPNVPAGEISVRVFLDMPVRLTADEQSTIGEITNAIERAEAAGFGQVGEPMSLQPFRIPADVFVKHGSFRFPSFCRWRYLSECQIAGPGFAHPDFTKAIVMGNHEVNWSQLSDPLLLLIFSYLDAKELVTVSSVCSHWSKVSTDNYLWKRRLHIDFKINPRKEISSFCIDGSWRSEYIRLVDASPKMESEVLASHTDEVLHVRFNSDGSMFATCSKDCTLKIWETSYPCVLLHDKDMTYPFHWQYTQFSQFNSDDSLILVSGALSKSNTSSGEIIVFAIRADGLEFQCRVLIRPYDVFGCWYDDCHVVSGQVRWISQMSSTSDIYVCSASQEIESERKSIIARMFRFFNRANSTIHMTLVSSHVSPWLRYAVETTKKFVEATKSGMDFVIPEDDFQKWEASNQECEMKSSEGGAEYWPDKLLIFSTGSLAYTPHQIGFKLLKGQEVKSLFDADVMPPERVQAVMEQMRRRREQRAAGSSDSDSDAENSDSSLGENPEPDNDNEDTVWQQIMDKFDLPDHVVELNGHVIGVALTADERYLLVNVRPWPDGCVVSDPAQPPPIAQQIELCIIDLDTLTLLDVRYRSHKGFTSNDGCFFIFLDACDQYVASGSEDSHAYVWDRHFGCLAAKLPHSGVVNSVACHPSDPTILISVSDDHMIKVWRSNQFMRDRLDGSSIEMKPDLCA